MKLVFYISLFLSNWVISQNFVPNSSFENTSTCGFTMGDLSPCIDWEKIGGTADYYNGCVQSSDPGAPDVPTFTGQFSRSGIAMTGLFASERYYGDNLSEYIYAPLSSFLDSGVTYFVEFHVQLSNRSNYGIGSLGALFTDTIPTHFNLNWVASRIYESPQIINSSLTSIIDYENWTKVSGNFIANGTEKYILIGNFVPDSISNMTNSGVTAYDRSYYYIDDVCVSSNSEFCNYLAASLNKIDDIEVEIFPNPSNGIINISKSTNNPELVELINLSGQVLEVFTLNAKQTTIDISNLSLGIYYIRMVDSVVSPIKIVKK